MDSRDRIAAAVNARRLINGPDNGLMCISPLKHTWARHMWEVMRANEWSPKEIGMANDKKQYNSKDLSPSEKLMYDKTLAFLSNLDGIQFNNLTSNIGKHITSPEVSMCISRQAFEEAGHVDAYSLMIEAITDNPADIYLAYENDSIMAAKNEHILVQSQIVGKDFTPRNFALAVVANICLEGIYFYSGFLAFYILAKQGKMLNSADQIRYIQRDEQTHLELFSCMYDTLKIENPEIFDARFYEEVAALVHSAVQLESEWGAYIIRGGVMGVTPPISKQYIQSIADKRLARIGITAMYGTKDPIGWVESFSSVKGEKANFFETKVKGYQIGSLSW
jgi:ribonucleoside-diphosphate reductase beta chain